MPDPITWYALGRTVVDTESILEAVDAKMLTHNVDPSAHGQDYEAIWEHRSAELLDHVNYSIYNIKLAPQTRTVKAFVSGGGEADFADIQQAIDYTSLLGGGIVFIKNGTYLPTADITVPSNIHIQGESMDGVIIDFNGGTFQFLAEGSGNDSPSGTIAINEDSGTIDGTSTAFLTEVEAGQYIRINDAWYEVSSITDDTHLNLVITYRGHSQTGLSYDIMTPLKNIEVDTLSIKGSHDSYAGYFHYVKDSSVHNIRTFSNTHNGIKFTFLADCSVKDIYSDGNLEYGILIDQNQSTYYSGLSSISNNEVGLYYSGDASSGNVIQNVNCSHNGWYGFHIIVGNKATFLTCTAVDNGADGFRLVAVTYINILGCFAEGNDADGIVIANNNSRCKIEMCTCLNNAQYGIEIAGGASGNSKNIVIGNVALGNTSGEISDGGTGDDVAHNIVT